MSERIPSTIPGVMPLKGNRNPVRLVKVVVTKNSAVKMRSRRAVSSPYTRKKPAAIPTRLTYTCRSTNCTVFIPRIIRLSFPVPGNRHCLRLEPPRCSNVERPTSSREGIQLVSCPARGRFEQGFDLGVQFPRDCESSKIIIGSQETRHGVVRKMHAVGPLVDRNRHRRIGTGVRHIGGFLHQGEWIAIVQSHLTLESANLQIP